MFDRKALLTTFRERLEMVVQRSGLSRGEFAEPSSTSDNHRGRGQSLLMSDGSARFVSSPILENGDNIWVPGHGGRLQSGREMPESDLDAFVGP